MALREKLGSHNNQYVNKKIAKAHAEGVREGLNMIDPLDLVISCVPDCTPEQHGYHQGTWDAHIKLMEILRKLKEDSKESKE